MYIFQPDRYLLQEQLRKAISFVKGRTLDIGAGTSDRYSANFSTTEYIRMDLEAIPGVDVVGSIYEIPLADASVDSLVCTQVFEHLARPMDAIKEVYRVLRSGGHAVITVPQTNELHEEPHDYFRYTNFGLQSLCTDAGFTVVQIDQRGGFYAMLAQMKIRYWIDKFHLYKRPFLGRIVGKYIYLYGHYMLRKDARSKTIADRKHAIGWSIIVTK